VGAARARWVINTEKLLAADAIVLAAAARRRITSDRHEGVQQTSRTDQGIEPREVDRAAVAAPVGRRL